MNDEWPGDWQSGRQKQLEEAAEMPDNEDGVSFTNDHGTIYMVGDTDEKDEWLWFDTDEPALELST